MHKCVGTTSCALFASGFKEPAVINFDQGWTHLWLTDLQAATIYSVSPTTGKILSKTSEHGGTADYATGIAPAPGPTY